MTRPQPDNVTPIAPTLEVDLTQKQVAFLRAEASRLGISMDEYFTWMCRVMIELESPGWLANWHRRRREWRARYLAERAGRPHARPNW